MPLLTISTMMLSEGFTIYILIHSLILTLYGITVGLSIYWYKTSDKEQIGDDELELHIASLDPAITSKNWEWMSKSEKNIELNNDLAPWGFAYYAPQDLFYSRRNGWQRNCGYCQLYDEGSAALSMIIDCEPIYFKYAGKNWLIEFWKGQYGMTTGCEIGIYNTTDPIRYNPAGFNSTFYNCAEDKDQINMSFTLHKNNNILLQRNELHWWLTCFRLAEFSHPWDLVMKSEIRLKDSTMKDAFVEGMINAGYQTNDLSIRGNSVAFTYGKPRNRQPLTRTAIIEFIMQTNNFRNCLAYTLATRSIADNTLDRLFFVKEQAPKLYRKIMDIGHHSDIFKHCDKITDILEGWDDETMSAFKLYGPDINSAYNSSLKIEALKSL